MINVSSYRPLSAFKTQEINDILTHDTSVPSFVVFISGCEWRIVCANVDKNYGLELGLIVTATIRVATKLE